ncbi:MAG TPA: hypothetical protein VKM93_05070 [Terriglobia bacterium]|nr:hypothetical protein [Terriglobia bacterium]
MTGITFPYYTRVMGTEKLLNPRQAALRLGRSHEWVYTQIRRGLIPFVTVDRIGLSVAPAIRLEEDVVKALAGRLRRVDKKRQEARVIRAQERAKHPELSEKGTPKRTHRPK